MKLRSISAAIALTATAVAPLAHAQYYGGVVLSGAQARSEFGFNGSEKPSEVVDLNQLSRGLNLSAEPSIGMKLGYRFTPYFSVEGRYADRAAFNALNLFQTDASSVRAKSMGLDLVGTLPVFKQLLLQGRAGFRSDNLNAADTTSNLASLAYGTRPLSSGALGVGLQYNFNSSLGLRFEVERSRKFATDRAISDADNVMFGVYWRF